MTARFACVLHASLENTLKNGASAIARIRLTY